MQFQLSMHSTILVKGFVLCTYVTKSFFAVIWFCCHWLGHSYPIKTSLLHHTSKINVLRSKEVYWQNPESLFFRGGHFWRAKSKKNGKKFLKIFIVPKRLLGHTDHLYTGAPIGGIDNQCHEASRLFDWWFFALKQ